MKKILTILTVALLACSTVFAAVNLTAILYNMAPQSSNTTSTSGRYERNEDGEPICRNCGEVLSAVEQRRGVCSECGERTGI